MEQVKNALKSLEDAVIKLEEAVYASKKERADAEEKVRELKQVIQHTYHRIDEALSHVKKGEA